MNGRMCGPQNARGQSLLEVVIAIALFSFVAGGIFFLLRNQITGVTAARQAARALAITEEGIEAVRSMRDDDWETLAPGTYGLALLGDTWTLVGSPDVTGGFTRTITIVDRSANEKEVTITTTWSLFGLRNRTTRLTTILSNWRNISAPVLYGDWKNPQSLGSIDLGPGNEARGLAVRSKIIYLAADAADQKKDDFYVIDTTDGANPSVLAQIHTGKGLAAVAVSGNYAYVAQDTNTDQLQIVNITDLAAPSLVSSKKTGSGNGLTVASTNGVVLIGTSANTGDELYVVNVSNPANPTIIASRNIGGSVNDIAIHGSYAYLATGNSSKEMMIFDISNPSNPTEVAAVDANSDQEARSISINTQDIRAYLALENDGSRPEVMIIDIYNPLVPATLGGIEIGADVNAALSADYLVFLGVEISNQEFQTYEILDPTEPHYWSGLNFPQLANDIVLEDNTVYVAVRSNDALRIITSQ